MPDYVILAPDKLEELLAKHRGPYWSNAYVHKPGDGPDANDPTTLYLIDVVAQNPSNTHAPDMEEAMSVVRKALDGHPALSILDLRGGWRIADGVCLLLVLSPHGFDELHPGETADQRRWRKLSEGSLSPTRNWRVMRYVQPDPHSARNWIFYEDVEGEFDDEGQARRNAKDYSENEGEDLIGVFQEDRLTALYLDGIAWEPTRST